MSEALLAAGGLLENLGINPLVLLVQVVIFVTTFFILSKLLFGRVVSNMLQREGEMKQAKEAVERDRAESARMKKEYEDRLAEADRETYGQMQESLKRALAAASDTVAKAQAQAREETDKALAEIREEKREAKSQLREAVTRLTLNVAEKILETKLDTKHHGDIVRKFVTEKN